MHLTACSLPGKNILTLDKLNVVLELEGLVMKHRPDRHIQSVVMNVHIALREG